MTTVQDDKIIAAGRRWIGTPYLHQASMRGVGADCLGLIRGVWRDLLGHEPEAVPPYTPDWSEPARNEVLWNAAGRWLRPCGSREPSPGRVLLFRMREGGVAKHLGIAAMREGALTVIHAYSGHGVVESPLSDPWLRRIVATFAFPLGD